MSNLEYKKDAKHSKLAAKAVLAVHIIVACFLVARCIIVITNMDGLKQPLPQKISLIESNASAISVLITLFVAIIGTLVVGFYFYYLLVTKTNTMILMSDIKDNMGVISASMHPNYIEEEDHNQFKE